MSRSVIVVDLGTSKTVAMKASLSDKGALQVAGLVSTDGRGMKKGAIQSIEDAGRAADTALRHLEQELGGIDITKVVLTISGTQLEGSTVQGFKPIIPSNRTITNQDVMEVVNHSRSGITPPGKVQVQTIPREFRVDEKRNISQPVGIPGSKLEVVSYMINGQKEHVANYESAITLLGREVEQFILGPMASGIGVLNGKEMLQGAVVVDLGASKTDVAVFVEGSLAWTITIPVGGNNITGDLAQLLNVSLEEGERLKIQHGSAIANGISDRDAIDVKQLGQPQGRPMQRKVLCEIIESRVKEMAKIIHAQVEKSGYLSAVKGSIVLTGGTAKLREIEKIFSEVFSGLEVRSAEPQLKTPRGDFGFAAVVGAAQFVLQTSDELEPISGPANWQDRIKGFWSMFSGKP
jgi:cell division protein FtsA